MPEKIRVGMIGAGQVAYGHCQGIQKHAAADLVAVADLDRKRARALQERFKLARATTRWEELVAAPDLDAVSIALPNALHAPVALAALRAGKHVMLDKPFALNAREARQVVNAARRAGRVFMLGMNQRFPLGTQMLRALVARGDIGEIYHAKAYWLRRTGSPKFGTWFCRKDLAGGGCMLDIGVHVLDACLFLMDNWDPVSVSASVYTKFGNRGIGEGGWGMSTRGKRVFDVDDFGTAFVKFRNGASLQLEASWVLHQAEPGRHNIELFGTEGGAAANPARVFRFGRQPGEYEIVEPQNVPVACPHGDRFVNWLDVILGRDKPMATAEQALVVQKILDGVYASAASGHEARIAR